MDRKTDRRSVKTQRALKKAFAALLNQKPLKNITVKELTDLADIHRATFYTHYEDVLDLYRDFENDIFENLTHIFEDPSLSSYQSFYNALLDYVQDNPIIAKILFSNSDETFSSPLLQKLLDYLITACKKVWSEENNLTEITTELEYFAHYRIHGIIAIIRHWICCDYSMPLDELKILIAKLDATVDSLMLNN